MKRKTAEELGLGKIYKPGSLFLWRIKSIFFPSWKVNMKKHNNLIDDKTTVDDFKASERRIMCGTSFTLKMDSAQKA